MVVNWDQRGAGLSYSKQVPASSMTVSRFVEDAHDLVQLLLRRFGQSKLFVVGHSWGSILGTMLVQRYPELFHAYVGIGQVTNMVESEPLCYRLTLEAARRQGNAKALKALERIGAPPYRDPAGLAIQRDWMDKLGGGIHRGTLFALIFKGLSRSTEYTLADGFTRWSAGARFSNEAMWGEVCQIDLPRQVPALEVPVLFCMGRHDLNTPSVLAERYLERLEAPRKTFVWFEASAHCPNFEEPERFAEVLLENLLPECTKDALLVDPVLTGP